MADPVSLPPLPEPAIVATQIDSTMRRSWVRAFSADQMREYALAYARQLAGQAGEATRSQKLAAAGFTPRDTRLTCDECGAKFTRQFAPLHECATHSAIAQALSEEQIRRCYDEAHGGINIVSELSEFSIRVARAIERAHGIAPSGAGKD